MKNSAHVHISCYVLLALLSILLMGCTRELPTLTAESSVQLTDALVLDAELSKNNQSVFLLIQGPVFGIWDIESQKRTAFIGAENLPANTRQFALSEGETRLLTSDGKSLSLWQMDDVKSPGDLNLIGTLDFSVHLGDARITSMAFINDAMLVTGNSDGSMIFADLVNQVFRKSQFHSNEVAQVLPGDNKLFLYSAGNDGKVVVTDLQQFKIKQEFSAPFRITSLISDKENSLLFISDALERQVFWDPIKNEVTLELDYWQQYRFFRLGIFIDEQKQIITTSPKTDVSLWDTSTGTEVASWQATSHSMGSAIMDIHPLSKNRIITLTSDAVIEVWDMSALY